MMVWICPGKLGLRIWLGLVWGTLRDPLNITFLKYLIFSQTFVSHVRPITSFGYKNDFLPKQRKRKKKRPRIRQSRLASTPKPYVGPIRDLNYHLRYLFVQDDHK